jgi:hypothetical protein
MVASNTFNRPYGHNHRVKLCIHVSGVRISLVNDTTLRPVFLSSVRLCTSRIEHAFQALEAVMNQVLCFSGIYWHY